MERFKGIPCYSCKQILNSINYQCNKCSNIFCNACESKKIAHRVPDSLNRAKLCIGTIEVIRKADDEESIASNDSRSLKRKRGDCTGQEDDDYDNYLDEKVDRVYGKIKEVSNHMFKLPLEIKNVLKAEFADMEKRIKNTVMSLVDKKLEQLVHSVKSLKPNLNSMDKQSDSSSNTYASIAKKSKVENLVIIPKEKQNIQKTMSEIKKNVNIGKLGVGLEKINTTKRGVVVVGCSSKADKDKLADEISKNIGKDYEVKLPQKKLPKIKVINVESDIITLSNEEISDCIVSQNEVKATDATKILVKNKFVKKDKNVGSLIIEVDPTTHKYLLSMELISLGWKNCRVFDCVSVLRCFKCWGFHHFARECKGEAVCRKCAGSHEEKLCNSEEVKCVNCTRMINIFKMKDVDNKHVASDENCICYKRQLDRMQRNTQYADD